MMPPQITERCGRVFGMVLVETFAVAVDSVGVGAQRIACRLLVVCERGVRQNGEICVWMLE